MKTKIPSIEIVLPIFNEAENIGLLVKQLDAAAGKLEGQAHISYLFIDDGSTDGSSDMLERLYKQRGDVRVIRLIHNFGHPAALSCGLEYFDADIAVFMDADLQDAPSSLLEMFTSWKHGAKTVVAERASRSESNRLLFEAFYRLLHATSKTIPPINFGTHCLLDRSVVERMRQLKERNRYFPGLVAYSSTQIESLRFHRGARVHGASRVGLIGLVNLAVTALLSFSTAPIRVVSVIGVCCSAAAFLTGIGIISIKLFTTLAIPGWASMMVTSFFGIGLQLLCLGLIGEYVARIYDEVKERPLYLVDQAMEKRPASRKAA